MRRRCCDLSATGADRTGPRAYHPRVTIDPVKVLERLRARETLARQAGAERERSLRARLPDLLIRLRKLGASRVRLFGSLARHEATATSDVDLALHDLPSDRYFDALSEAMAVLGCPVDLVRWEEAGESLRARIDAEGEEL